MSSTCSPLYVGYVVRYNGNLMEKNYDERYKLRYDSLDVIFDSRYVSYPGGHWGLEVYLGLENHHTIPVRIDLNCIKAKMEGYELAQMYVLVEDTYDAIGRHVNNDSTTVVLTIMPDDSCYFKYHFKGAPLLPFKKAKKYRDTLKATVTLSKIYLRDKELHFKPFTLSAIGGR